MNKKNVIIIRNANSYDFGGGERFPVFLASELLKLGYEPLIVSRSPKLLVFARDNKVKAVNGWWWQRQNWSGKNALLFPVYIVWQLLLTVWYFVLFMRKKPDVIHIQSKDDFISATIAGKILGKRIVWTDHADLKHIFMNVHIWNKNPVGKLVYWTAKHADAITLVSESERELVRKNLAVNDPILEKLHIIYNGIVDVSSKYKSKHNSKTFTFCTVSRMVTYKGIKEMIDAFVKLSGEYPNIKLIMVGDGPEEEKFEGMAKKYKNIEFLGYQSDPLGYMGDSDVYLHATYHEGFSVSLIEASMMNCPIIATAVGGNLEIIQDHQTGLLVPFKDVDALYDAMKELYNDKRLHDKLAKNAREQYVKRFQFDQIVKDEFIPLYEGGKK